MFTGQLRASLVLFIHFLFENHPENFEEQSFQFGKGEIGDKLTFSFKITILWIYSHLYLIIIFDKYLINKSNKYLINKTTLCFDNTGLMCLYLAYKECHN